MKAIIGLFLIMAATANAQTPPISMIHVPGDTIASHQVVLTVEVFSDIPWDQEQVGVYWTASPMSGWSYAGATRDTLVWAFPADGQTYFLATSVVDNEGNDEGHEFIYEATVYACASCFVPENEGCPPQTMLGLASDAAALGVLSWGTAETPMIEWYWTHPTTGSQVVSYTMELEILSAAGDTTRATFPGLTEMDSLYGYGRTPYPMIGEQQRVIISGMDAEGRTGPPSVPAAWFGDDGPPGQPGTALKHLVMEGP